jgi:integrase
MPLYVEPRANGIWYIRGTFQGVAVRRSADTKDKATAEAVRALVEKEILARILDPSKPANRDRLSFADACDEYLTKGQGAAAGPAQKRIVQRLRDHPPLGARAIDTIDQIAVDEAVSALVGDDAAPATKIRAVIGPVATVLRHHAARGRCARPAFAKPQVPTSRTPFLEPRQALALIDAAAPHLKPLLAFLFGTGARLGEALGLDWAQVDLQAARARLIDTKNGADRIAALPPSVVVAMASLPAAADGSRAGPVFRRDDGAPYADREGEGGGQIKTGWKAACRRAGLVVPARNPDGTPALDKDGKRIMLARFKPHDARHSWATWFYALSRNLLLLKDEGGWKSDDMVTRYAKLMRVDLEADVALVWGGHHPRIAPETRPAYAQVKTAS